MSEKRHIVAFSGGKDSSALAIYLHDPERWRRALGKKCDTLRPPLENAEYVFCDTGTELPETYEYIEKLEAYLGKTIIRLQPDAPPGKTPFDHYQEKMFNGFLPSARMRWCTRVLKIKPFERYIQDDPVINYVGIRADEDREGYISTKPNIETVFPFMEDGLVKEDIYRILDDSGVGRPDYYKWRSRSGCYFCFFQRKSEWVGLLENHPELFEEAKAYEKTGNDDEGKNFTWDDRESLEELSQPERVAEIKRRTEERRKKLAQKKSKFLMLRDDLLGAAKEWSELDEMRDLEDDSVGCNICHR